MRQDGRRAGGKGVRHAALLALLTLASPATQAGDYDALFRKHGAAHGVDWRLLKAVCEVESHLNPRAEHPGGLSAGLCQIHCAPAHAGVCRNRFNVIGWPPASRAQLYEPDYNVSLAAQILGWNLRTYGLAHGVGVYNQWSARHTPAGQPLPNQFYVDKVLARYRALKERDQRAVSHNNTRSTGRSRYQAQTSPGDRAGLPTIRAK